jgi:glycosyltransferase involved in cell wall biosynthesis
VSELPEVTVVVPARNEVATIDRTLRSVLAQDFDGALEIVVADGRSSDGTREAVERLATEDPRIRLVENPAGETPAALNAALAVARGRWLVRIDGHSRVPPDYVRRLVDHLRSGACDGVGGRKLAVGRGAFGRAVAAAHGSRFGIGDSRYHFDGRPEYVDHVPFGAYATERARRIGGWEERFRRNQDFEFDWRYVEAGGRLLLDPGIEVEWNVRETPAALARQYFEYGSWRCRTLARHPRSLHVRWLAPPVLATALVAGAGLSWTRPGRLALGAVGSAYLGFVAVGAAQLARRTGVHRRHAALALACMHVPWGAGFALSAVRSSHR